MGFAVRFSCRNLGCDMKKKLFTLAAVLGPPLAIVALAYCLWGEGVGTVDLVLLVVFYLLTVIGLTAGFHRLFAHRSFSCTPGLNRTLGILGCMAAQGPIYYWVATHRKHHLNSDRTNDPHSPHVYGGSFLAVCRGWYHAHMGWMFDSRPENILKHCADLRRDHRILWIDRYYPAWVALGILSPAVIAGLVGGDLLSFLRGALWGGFVRVFAVQHVTWSINSICHLFGHAPFRTGDRSRNNAICALLSFGEGWHNNHHAFPYSARHGLLSGQPDPTYALIRLGEKLGAIWEVKIPVSIIFPPEEKLRVDAALDRERTL